MASSGYVANTLTNLVRVRGRGGFRPTQRDFTVSASTQINVGDIVQISTGSVLIQSIAVPSTNATAVASGGNLPILGIALSSISTAASGAEATTGRTTIPVAVLDDNTEVGLRVYSTTAGDAELTDVTTGTTYQFANYRGSSASEWWYVAITTTTNGELVLTDKPKWEPSTDDYGFAWFRANTSETVRQG